MDASELRKKFQSPLARARFYRPEDGVLVGSCYAKQDGRMRLAQRLDEGASVDDGWTVFYSEEAALAHFAEALKGD